MTMRKLFWVPLVLFAFIAGAYYGMHIFIREMAELRGCSTEEWTRWYRHQKKKREAMRKFR
jgi:hypothetical protein